jgi:hypothetical protein
VIETFLTVVDIGTSFRIPAEMGAAGLVIWGSSSDGKTEERCRALESYVRQTFGPTVREIVEARLACSVANCSSHGRCAALFPGATSACQCFAGFDGPSCATHQPSLLKSDDAMAAADERPATHGPNWRRAWNRASAESREAATLTPECEATILSLCGRRSDYDTVKACYHCGDARILENFTKRHCSAHTTTDCCNSTTPYIGCTQGNCTAGDTHEWCLHPPKPPPPPCPAHLKASVAATGLLPVAMFNFTTTDDGSVYHDDAVRHAINATKLCGGAVFFGPGIPWRFERTVVIDDRSGLELRGAGAGSAQFQTGEQATIHGPAKGPAFLLNGSTGFVEKVWFANLAIIGRATGVKIFNGALIRFTNVMITINEDADGVNVTADGCHGCNVVFNSDNAALVVEDTFWLWAEDSSFIFEPHVGEGQRPPVIFRGTDKDGHNKSVNSV